MKIKNFIHSFRQKTLTLRRRKPDQEKHGHRGSRNRNKRVRRMAYSGACLMGVGALVMDRLKGEDLDIIHTASDFSNSIIDNMESLNGGRYFSSPVLPIRCMEIIYGNKFDNRMKHVEYNREIIYMPDKENIALGKLIRLAVRRKQDG